VVPGSVECQDRHQAAVSGAPAVAGVEVRKTVGRGKVAAWKGDTLKTGPLS